MALSTFSFSEESGIRDSVGLHQFNEGRECLGTQNGMKLKAGGVDLDSNFHWVDSIQDILHVNILFTIVGASTKKTQTRRAASQEI